MHAGELPHHTRLPRYVRGRRGVIERVHGAHVFADAHATGRGEQPQWLYTVVFDARELWPDAVRGVRVSVDAWEPYMGGMTAGPSRHEAHCRERGAAAVLPGADSLLLQDGPVFREPWEGTRSRSRSLHEAACSRGRMGRPLAEQIGAASARRCRPRRHLLPPLARRTRALVAQRRGVEGRIAGTAQAWDEAAERTPHGQPIELKPEDFHH